MRRGGTRPGPSALRRGPPPHPYRLKVRPDSPYRFGDTVAEVVNDPQFLARGMLVEHFDERIGRNVLGPGVVPVLSESPGGVRFAGSTRPGQHNTEVYGQLLGLDQTAIDELTEEGVL